MKCEQRADLLAAIARLSQRYPDWRLGQLIANVAGWADQEIWDVEDEQVVGGRAAAPGAVDAARAAGFEPHPMTAAIHAGASHQPNGRVKTAHFPVNFPRISADFPECSDKRLFSQHFPGFFDARQR